jgi:hypothetical protein
LTPQFPADTQVHDNLLAFAESLLASDTTSKHKH